MSDQHYKVVISADGKQLRGEFQTLTPAIKATNTQLDGTTTRGHQAGNALAHTTRHANASSQSLQRLTRYAATAFAGLQFAQVIKGSVGTAAAMQDINTRMQSLSATTIEYASNRRFLIDLGERHHKTITGLSGAYSRLMALEQGGIVTGAQSRTILEGMSNAGSALGATNQQLEDSFYGLAQGLASPIVAYEEIKQVTDPLPGLLQKIESSAGLAGGGLKKMAADGQITSEFFKTSLIKALQQYDGAAAKTYNNISAHTRDLQREYELFISMLDQPIGAVANTSLDTLAGSMVFLREHSELATAAVVLLGARGAVGLTNLTAAKVKSTVASFAAKRADDLAAISANKLAAANVATAQSALIKATRTKAAALGSVAASEQVKLATQKLSAAQAQQAITSNAAAAASGRLSIKTRLLSGAGALIGGPMGVFTLAAVAIGAFAFNARNGTGDVKALRQEVNALLGRNDAAKRDSLNTALEKAKKTVKELKLEAVGGLDSFLGVGLVDTQALTKQNALIKEAQQYVTDLKAEINKLDNKNSPSKKATGAKGDPLAAIKAQQAAEADALAHEQGQAALARLEYELLLSEQKIEHSYQRRRDIIISNTIEGSEKQKQLLQSASLQRIDALHQLYDQETAMEDAKNQKVVASAKEAASQKKQILQDSLASAGQIFGNMASILQEGSKKQFEQGKKMAQAQAAISGGLAIIKAYEQGGPYLGPILAATIGGLTAIQMAKINQQQYQPVAHGGMTYNPSERSVTIVKGERIVSPRQNQDMMGILNNLSSGQGGQQLTQNFNLSSFNPMEGLQILRSVRGVLGSQSMQRAG